MIALRLAALVGLGLLLAAGYFWNAGKESLVISTLVSATIIGAGAGVVAWPAATRQLHARWWRFTGWEWTVLAVWGALAAAAIACYAPSGWDEGAYLLSGLYLRGYPVPYAIHRAPVTHFVSAAFADAPWLQAAFLQILLAGILFVWGRRRWGRELALLPLALLPLQNVFAHSAIEVMSEMPAAVLVAIAFERVSRDKWFQAGVLFALLVLTRFNLAVIPVVLSALILYRFGWQRILPLAAGAAVVALAWLAFSVAVTGLPFAHIYQAVLVVLSWVEDGQPQADVFSRTRFYFGHLFFLTPLGFAALIASPFARDARVELDREEWLFRIAMPVSVFSYCFAMLFIGAHFPRFMLPVLPIAMMVLADVWWTRRRNGASGSPVLGVAVIVCVTAASGVWPADITLKARQKLGHRDVFTARLRDAIVANVRPNDRLVAMAVPELSLVNAHGPMMEIRHTIELPAVRRDQTGDILPDEGADALARLLALVRPGDLLLLPSRYALSEPRLIDLDGWVLHRVGGARGASVF